MKVLGLLLFLATLIVYFTRLGLLGGYREFLKSEKDAFFIQKEDIGKEINILKREMEDLEREEKLLQQKLDEQSDIENEIDRKKAVISKAEELKEHAEAIIPNLQDTYKTLLKESLSWAER